MESLNTELLDLYKFIEENYKSQSNDIFYYLELLLDSIINTKNALGEDIKKNSHNFSKIESLLNYAKKIESIEKTANCYLNAFSLNSSPESEEMEEDDEKCPIPNYKEYEVDQEVPHLLTENFTHKKICSFLLENIRYNVGTWQSALIKLCEVLINKDIQKFNSFVNSDLFCGNKRNYFSYSGKEQYYKRINDTNIYVWTNLNTNTICKIMRKLLREYNIPTNSLYIYLIADYTALHNTVPESPMQEQDIDKKVKIGKYVRECMRKLSNQHYRFSQNTLNKLTNDNATKELFGIGTSFFREVKPNADISRLIKDTKGYNRYWKEIFRFNNKDFIIVSQWTEVNSERFKTWLNSLPNKSSILLN